MLNDMLGGCCAFIASLLRLLYDLLPWVTLQMFAGGVRPAQQ